jgi:hypothetical protein
MFDEHGNIIGRYLDGFASPEDAIDVTNIQWANTLNPAPGKVYKLVDGLVTETDIIPVVAPDPTSEELCKLIDSAADKARSAVVVDPVRAIEYDRSREAAEQFKAAGYPEEDVPAMVAAWAIGGRTSQQAADDILNEAAAYMGALEFLRTLRLKAKQEVRDLFATEGGPDIAGAQAKVAETVEIIRQAVEGVGNARVAA